MERAKNKYIEKLFNFLVNNYDVNGNEFLGFYLKAKTKADYLKAVKAIKKINSLYELVKINKVVNIHVLNFEGVKK